jgi:hypothetical protein
MALSGSFFGILPSALASFTSGFVDLQKLGQIRSNNESVDLTGRASNFCLIVQFLFR